MAENWKITLRVYRQKENQAPHFDNFQMDVNPDEYVLDAVERAWAFHDLPSVSAMPVIIPPAVLAGCA